MASVALSSGGALEVMEVHTVQSNLRSPRAIRLDLVDGERTCHSWVKLFATPVGTKEHESILFLAVLGLAVGHIRVVVLTVDLNIRHGDLNVLALTSSLEADTLLIIDESHIMHAKVLSVVHRGETTISILVGGEVATLVAGGARANSWVGVDVGTSSFTRVSHVVAEDSGFVIITGMSWSNEASEGTTSSDRVRKTGVSALVGFPV